MKKIMNAAHRLVRGIVYFVIGGVVGAAVGAIEGLALGVLDVKDGEVYHG